MQTIEGRLIYSASDLNNYLECAHLTTLDGSVVRDGLERPAPSERTNLIAGKGAEHEAGYLQSLRRRGVEIVELPGERGTTIAGLNAAAAQTEAAMAAGAALIYQGSFFDGTFLGRSDFLRRVETPSEKWPWSYEVIDTKLALDTKPYFLIQLCHYSEQLARVQGTAPKHMHVVLGNGREQSYAVADFDAYYRRLKLDFLRDAPSGNGTYPLPVAHCKVCSWTDVCERRRRADDSLTLVAWMRNEQAARLQQAGLATTAALAAAGDGQRPRGMLHGTFERLRLQAALQLEQRETGKLRYTLLEGPAWTGFGLLPPPAQGDVFFDMEGDPLFDIGTGLEYLFGCWLPDDERQFMPFWGTDRGGEKAAFEQFIDFITARRRRYPESHVYHYAPYETVALEKLAQRHATREDEVDELLRALVFVDLFAVVRQALMVSQESYSIKKLEPFYGFTRATSVQKGDDSILQFEQWLRSRDSAILADIEAYNRDDCRSTFLLREWLLERRLEAIRSRGDDLPFRKGPDAPCHEEFTEGCKSCERDRAKAREDERTSQTQRRLLEGITAPEDRAQFAAMPEDQRARYLLGNLIAYHRREDKPIFWEFYHRCSDVDRLVEFDKDCLAGLVLCSDIPPYKAAPNQRLMTHTYRFPPQLHDVLHSTLYEPRTRKPAGEIVDLDEEHDRVAIKLSSHLQSTPELVEALIPLDHVSAEVQTASLVRTGEAYLAGGGLQSALADLLFARAPRLAGRPAGATIQPDTVSSAAIAAVVRSLEGGVLFIQGPPGTGKSTKASAVIVDLLAAGKRVGVMSNSHKAIHNLVNKVEQAADARNFRFRGVHKHSEGNDGSAYESVSQHDLVRSEKNAGAVESGAEQFISGNAWLFARPDMAGKLDFLFIDEAGQIALADALAVAPCTTNLVLIGDPLQLAQVSKGTHPFGAGVSVLDHLLGEHHTIPEDRGIFLDVTYRLHPAICDFISPTIYDGRLRAGENTARQRIGNGGLFGDGLRYAALVHSGNSRESPEEATRTAELACALIGQPLLDEHGVERPAEARDIIIVAPYNAQRRLIEKRLLERGCAIRVGTVDKFQGQEAFAVIYSMATSSDQDAPRGLDFLFDKNRFNVAISRARALPIVVCSDRLVGARGHTLEQIRLLSLFCRYVELAAPLS